MLRFMMQFWTKIVTLVFLNISIPSEHYTVVQALSFSFITVKGHSQKRADI